MSEGIVGASILQRPQLQAGRTQSAHGLSFKLQTICRKVYALNLNYPAFIQTCDLIFFFLSSGTYKVEVNFLF